MANWLYKLDTGVHVKIDTALVCSYNTGKFEIVKWLYELDPTIISKNIKKLDNFNYDMLGISKETSLLFQCIKNEVPFPEIDYIDECIIYSLVHYNMVDHLVKLRERFHFICFDIVDGKITDFTIKHFSSKSARKLF